MVVEEMPAWLANRGFDADRRALWGWSMGGYGCLRLAETYSHWALAVAAFSPAMRDGESVFDDAGTLAGLPLGIWCGTDDSLYPTVKKFVAALPEEPEVASFSEGAHTRVYWNDQTLDAFAFLSRHLAPGS
jgi:S-formylglutathione hydrolase FrmB